MLTPIRTRRLLLRQPDLSDATWIAAEIVSRDVHRWLNSVVYPYARSDAVRWIKTWRRTPTVRVIVEGDTPVGVVGASGELGYWLRDGARGRGLMTEAAAALVDLHFETVQSDLDASYMLGNEISAGVLGKLGFAEVGVATSYSHFWGRDVPIRTMTLRREDWLARRQLPNLVTPRLTLRPLTHGDAPALAAMAGTPEVAPMIMRATIPWAIEDVRSFIDVFPWRGRPGLRLGVCLRDGTLIGTVGLSARPFAFYFLAREHWGKGYASEAMEALLRACYDQFELDEIGADVFVDNPASMRVLSKLGFEEVGEGVGTSAARVEPAPQKVYRLSKSRFKART